MYLSVHYIESVSTHIYSEPSGYEDSRGPPVAGSKMHPEMPGNKYFSSFRQLWVIQSPPPNYIEMTSVST